MRKIKLMLLAALLSIATVGGALAASSTSPGVCTNTGCDYPGQKGCPYLENANCIMTPKGCQGWNTCGPPQEDPPS